MSNQKPFSILDRLKSITLAFRGMIQFFHSEHNAIVHLLAAIAVITAGIWLSISTVEWLLILVAIGFVFSAELFNTAIEKLADEITKDYSESIKKIKDLSAAAVLVAAITAAIIGMIIFIPLILDQIFH